jgi:hypothetical protein
MKINSDGLLESMLLVFVVAALLAFNKFLLISFAGVGSRFLGLMTFLLIMSLVLMLWTMSLYKLKIIEEVKLLDPMIFVVFASLFGFVLFFPAVYYLEGWWIIHTIGTVVVVSLILAKIMVGLVAGKSFHLFRENKKQREIPSAG